MKAKQGNSHPTRIHNGQHSYKILNTAGHIYIQHNEYTAPWI